LSWNFRAFLLALGLLGLVYGLLVRAVHAGDLTATWQKPETNCDGSPITNLAGFRAYWGPYRAELPDPAAASYAVTGLPPGQWWLAVTAYNSENVESPVAGPVLKVIAPEDFKVSEPTAYTIVKHTNTLLLLPVGTVPVGTVCNAAQSVNGRYAVPRDAVTWSGSIRPAIVVASCH